MRTDMWRYAMVLGALVGLTACEGSVSENPGEGGGGTGGTGGAPSCDAPEGAGEFAVGTGEDCFEPLASNAEVPLMSGPQGGYHVWLAIGCEDCGSPVELHYGARDAATGEAISTAVELQEMVPLSGSWPQAAGIVVNMPGIVWDPENEPPPAKGTHIVLWAKAYEGDTVVHEAEVEVVIGETVDWNPCVEDPDHPSCNLG